MRAKTALAIAVTVAAFPTISGQAQAQQVSRYIGVDLVGASLDNDFGGFNSIGLFLNDDNQSASATGIALTFGLRDAWNWKSTAFTPEAEIAWFQDYDVVSASFPGLPSPQFFYDSNIGTGRLGLNVWATAVTRETWRAELGLGLGAVYRNITSSDGVVGGSGSDISAYGQVGVRYLRNVGSRGNLSVALNYVATSSTSVDLINSFDGSPAGNLDASADGFELRIGYQFALGR